MSHHLDLLTTPDASIREIILGGLRDFNRTHLMPGLVNENLAVAIRQGDDIVGGLWGRTGWGWLTVEYIFVPENLRGQGIAGQLIELAEEAALQRGCHSAWLDTLNPKALKLYESLGYMRFGELKNFPVGGSRHFLQKTLKPSLS